MISNKWLVAIVLAITTFYPTTILALPLIVIDVNPCRGDHSEVGEGSFQFWCHVAESNKTPTITGHIARHPHFMTGVVDGSGYFADGDLNLMVLPDDPRYLKNGIGTVNDSGLIEFEVAFTPPDPLEPDELDAVTKTGRSRVYSLFKEAFPHPWFVSGQGDWVEDSGHGDFNVSDVVDAVTSRVNPAYYTSGGKTELHPLQTLIGAESPDGLTGAGRSFSLLFAQDSSLRGLTHRFPTQRRYPSFVVPLDARAESVPLALTQAYPTTMRAMGVLEERSMLDLGMQRSRAWLTELPSRRAVTISAVLEPSNPLANFYPFYLAKFQRSEMDLLKETVEVTPGTCAAFGIDATPNKALAIEFNYAMRGTDMSAPVIASTSWSARTRTDGPENLADESPRRELQGNSATFIQYYAPKCDRPAGTLDFSITGFDRYKTVNPPSASGEGSRTRIVVAKDISYSYTGSSVKLQLAREVDTTSTSQFGTVGCRAFPSKVTASVALVPTADIQGGPRWRVMVEGRPGWHDIPVGGSYTGGGWVVVSVSPNNPLELIFSGFQPGATRTVQVSFDGQTDFGEVLHAETIAEGKCYSFGGHTPAEAWARAEMAYHYLLDRNLIAPGGKLPNVVPGSIVLPQAQARTNTSNELYKLFRNIPRALVPVAKDFVDFFNGVKLPPDRMNRLVKFLNLGSEVTWQ